MQWAIVQTYHLITGLKSNSAAFDFLIIVPGHAACPVKYSHLLADKTLCFWVSRFTWSCALLFKKAGLSPWAYSHTFSADYEPAKSAHHLFCWTGSASSYHASVAAAWCINSPLSSDPHYNSHYESNINLLKLKNIVLNFFLEEHEFVERLFEVLLDLVLQNVLELHKLLLSFIATHPYPLLTALQYLFEPLQTNELWLSLLSLCLTWIHRIYSILEIRGHSQGVILRSLYLLSNWLQIGKVRMTCSWWICFIYN